MLTCALYTYVRKQQPGSVQCLTELLKRQPCTNGMTQAFLTETEVYVVRKHLIKLNMRAFGRICKPRVLKPNIHAVDR
jgi:hypothetical protein